MLDLGSLKYLRMYELIILKKFYCNGYAPYFSLYASVLEKELKIPRQTISKYLKVLAKKGLIEEVNPRTYPQFYNCLKNQRLIDEIRKEICERGL